MTNIDEMTEALKAHCVPLLRHAGFKGSFPNFYRDEDGFVCLVNFQFKSVGGAFCINLGFADPARRNVTSHCQNMDPKKLRVRMTGGLIENGNALSGRWRVGSISFGNGLFTDSWFSFSAGQHDQHQPDTAVDADELAQHCAKLMEEEAEAWWTGRRAFAASVDIDPDA